MFERWMIGLFGASVVALTAVCVASVLLRARFELLLNQKGWGVWAFLAGWLVLGALIARISRPVAAWRIVLGLTAFVLGATAVAGFAVGSALSAEFLAALSLGAVLCIAIAMMIGEERVKRPRVRRLRVGSYAAHRPLSTGALDSIAVWRKRVIRGLPFWATGIVFVESFRLAFVVNQDPARGAGMVGMLIAFFLLLPAASLATWLPRTSATLYAIAASGSAMLLSKTGMAQWAIAAIGATGLAVAASRDKPRSETERIEILQEEA